MEWDKDSPESLKKMLMFRNRVRFFEMTRVMRKRI